MKTKHIKAREINGENGVYVRTGNNTYTFEGIIEEPNGERVKYSFEVEGVETILDAINMVDFYYCGYFDKHSAIDMRFREVIKQCINKVN